MDLDLKNKRVVVTGASRGIGAAIANAFFQEEAKVCIVSRGSEQLYLTEKNLQETFGIERIFAAQCDCADIDSLKNLRDQLQKRWLGVDIVVANVWFSGGIWDEKIKQNPERVKKMIESTVPMNRFGTTDEMADVAVFICSERASFITGSILVVDGGETVWGDFDKRIKQSF
ncbi:MAG: SDR family oxidoreductase [Crocinitomicaceae bacterium]|jgi:NAD(P)-dependent dehydrogenase (short-subunit alcohol dehydrogenase family)|nr:SDR family oxidoreductase [Crocinitomicaceae bacterium]